MEKKMLLMVLTILAVQVANGEVPAVFILGDSTADTGTNSYLPGSTDRSDFPPYGIDFPHSRPTGRFSNGLNSADFLAKLIGFKRSPLPFFALLSNPKLINRPSFRGANFASAGAGLLNITGQVPSGIKNVIPLGEQIEQFSTIYSHLVNNKGQACAKTFFSKSLFFVSIGSNDIFSYYLSNSTIPKEEFVASLGALYGNYLMSLYQMGARKFGIISVPPIGCCPFQRTSEGCSEGLNDLAQDFYSVINAVLIKLSSEYNDMKYSLGNAYEMTINVIKNPSLFGFSDAKDPCCGDARTPCSPKTTYCSNRKEYLFWDVFHPTQKASWLAAVTLFTGDQQFVSPINFRQLAEA